MDVKVDLNIEIYEGSNYGQATFGDYTMDIVAVGRIVQPNEIFVPYYNEKALGMAYQFGRKDLNVFDKGVPPLEDIENARYIFGIKIKGFNRVYFDIDLIQINVDPEDVEIPEWVLETYDAIILVSDQDIQQYFYDPNVSDQKVFNEIMDLLTFTRKAVNGDLIYFLVYGDVLGHPALILETEVIDSNEFQEENLIRRIQSRLERMVNDAEVLGDQSR
jgi:hypothetical protein